MVQFNRLDSLVCVGMSPLAIAAESGHLELATILIKAGAKVGMPITGRNSSTGIFLAAQSGNLEMVRLLVRSGADPCLKKGQKLENVEIARFIHDQCKKASSSIDGEEEGDDMLDTIIPPTEGKSN